MLDPVSRGWWLFVVVAATGCLRQAEPARRPSPPLSAADDLEQHCPGTRIPHHGAGVLVYSKEELWPWAIEVQGEVSPLSRRAHLMPDPAVERRAHDLMARLPGCRRRPSHPRCHSVSIALPLAGGLLVGTDGGEWGGQLVWFPDDGQRPRRLAEGRFQTAFSVRERVFLLEGVAHRIHNHGRVLEVVAGERAVEVRTLADLGVSASRSGDGEWNVWTRDEEIWVGLHGPRLVRVALDGTVEAKSCAITTEEQERRRADAAADPSAPASLAERMAEYQGVVDGCRERTGDRDAFHLLFLLDEKGRTTEVTPGPGRDGPAARCVARAATAWRFDGVALKQGTFYWFERAVVRAANEP